MNAARIRDHIVDSLYLCYDEFCVLTEEHRIYLYDVVRELKKSLTELRRKQKLNYPILHGAEQEAANSEIRTTKQALGRCDELIKILRPIRLNRSQMEEIMWLLWQVPSEEQAPDVGEPSGNIVHPASGEVSNAAGDLEYEELSDADGDGDLASNRQPEAQPAPEPCNKK